MLCAKGSGDNLLCFLSKLGMVLSAFLAFLPAGPAAGEAVNMEACKYPLNSIVAENCLPGTTDWQIKKYSYAVAGFPSATSVNRGGQIDFFVTTTASSFDLSIYRIGYYNGAGGREVFVQRSIPGKQQPPCHEDSRTGLMSCSNWSVTYSLAIPAEWVTGIYTAIFRTPQGDNYTMFVVRDDSSRAPILYQQSVITYQAYNNYTDKSLYSQNSGICTTDSGVARAVEVSLNRPYNGSMDDPSSFFQAEYPMVRWLESQGYDVTYSTNIDTHLSGQPGAHNQLLDHRVFLSVGHDEYWTQEMRDAITQARDAGVNLGFFSANTGYWKIRLEPDPWTGQPDRTIVAYKTTEGGPADPSGIPTGTWRDPQGANAPENELIGVQYIGDNDQLYFPLRVNSEMASDRLFRNTGLQGMPTGTYVDIGKELVGWEWDAVVNNGYNPPGLTVLASSPVSGGLLIDAGKLRKPGTAFAQTTRYTAPSGAIVFASGTIQWSWGLDVHEPDRRIRQITYNLFSDMGVQPATPGSDLILDGSSASITPEPSQFSRVRPGEPVMSNLQVAVTGTSALISWTTDQPTTGQAWLVSSQGTFSGYGTSGDTALDSSYRNTHQLSFSGLQAGAEYHVQVISTDVTGRARVSDLQSFRTGPASVIDGITSQASSLASQAVCTIKPAGRTLRYWLRGIPVGAAFLGIGLILSGGITFGLYRRQRRGMNTGEQINARA